MTYLLEEFADTLDSLNDELTDITLEEFSGKSDIEVLFGDIDRCLSRAGLKLDFTDIEGVLGEWEEPTELEAVNIVIPLYDVENDVTEYNLSFTYAISDSIKPTYIVDLEVQYEWEVDNDIANEYIEIDD